MGPRKASALVFAIVLGVLYWPLTRVAEPIVREAWFRTITRALAADARGLEPPSGQLWLGATRPELPDSLNGIYQLESNLGRPLAITSFYQAWGDGREHEFPMDVLRSLDKGGYLPLLTWEPWLSAFGQFAGENPSGSLRHIARGELDDYIRTWAREAVRYGRSLLLRPGHEPTNPWYGWAPEYGNSAADYRAFWTRVRGIFREEGARNVLFVWTPYGLRERDWFPGVNDVDWIGFDILNYGSLSEVGTWLDFYPLMKLYYDAYGDLGPRLLVAETATTSAGGNKIDWVRDLFHSIQVKNFPKLRAIVLFDQPGAATSTGLPIDWSLDEVEGTYDMLKHRPELLAQFTREKDKAP
jgi:hypothetical protein